MTIRIPSPEGEPLSARDFKTALNAFTLDTQRQALRGEGIPKGVPLASITAEQQRAVLAKCAEIEPRLPDMPDAADGSITPELGDTQDQPETDKRTSELPSGSDLTPQPDLDAARSFLQLLTGEAAPLVRLRLVHDRDRDAPSIERAGTIEALWPDVEFAPTANVGTFFLPSCFGFDGDGFAHDKDATGFYCHFADFDKAIPTEWHRKPDIIVHTSVKDGQQRGAAYWLIERLPADQADTWKRNQARLLAYYGDDTSVKNPSRLMRLPGSLHMKREPQLVTFTSDIDADARMLGLASSDEVVRDLPAVAAPAQVAGSDVHELDLSGNIVTARSRLRDHVNQSRVSVSGSGGNNTAYQIAAELVRDLGLSPQMTFELMRDEWNQHCVPPWSHEELETIVNNAASYGQNEPGAYASRPAAETFAGAKLTEQQAKGGTDDAADWPEPFDVFSDTDYERNAKLTRDMLPEAIADFAFDEAERLGVEPAMIALPALAVASTAMHDNYQIEPREKDDWRESPRLWFLVVADPGGKKTPAIKKAVEPLQAIEDELHRDFAKQLAEYETALERYKAERKADPDAALLGIEKPKKPIRQELIADDVTVESLAPMLEANDRGILSLKDELSGFIGSFDAYRVNGGKDRAAYLQLWNGGPRKVSRLTEGRSFDIPNWSSSFLSGVQPEELRRIMERNRLHSDGLLQRFQPFFGVTTGIGIDREPNHTARSRFARAVRQLMSLPVPKPFGMIRLSPDARAYWDKIEKLAFQMAQAAENLPPLRNHAAKWASMFARLMLTIHALECVDAAGDAAVPLDRTVSGETAQKAYRLCVDFLYPQAMQFYDRFFRAAYEEEQRVRWVAGYILAHHKEVITARELKKYYRELEDDQEVLSVMEDLHRLGWVGDAESFRRGTGTSWRWPVNPQAHVAFAERAVEERADRKAQREAIGAKIAEYRKSE